jgi:hypothetical protein
VFIGNHIEPMYDMLMDLLGGRIVGVQKQHSKLADGEFYDYKIYEILRDDYLNARKNKLSLMGESNVNGENINRQN